MLVMDENRNFNVSPDYMRQLEWLIRRDRNHPSVILWSVFNEEPMQGTEIGYQMVRRMVAAVKALDLTRPVTATMNDGMFAPMNASQAVDVVGFNYQQDRYDSCHNLTGRAEVWLEGRLIGRKNDYGGSALTVSIPPGSGERTLTVIIRARPAQPFGFADIVTVEA